MSDDKKSDTVKVLIELKGEKGQETSAIFGQAMDFGPVGFELDTSYDPVPLQPAADMATALEASEEVMIVRGSVASDRFDELKERSDIVNVWLDTEIAPFEKTSPISEENLQLVDGMASCPISPCDCEPQTAKGDIPDVAQYLGVDDIWSTGHRGEGMVIGIVDGGIAAKGRAADGEIDRVVGGWPVDWGKKSEWGRHGNMTATDALGMAPKAKIYDIRISGGNSISAALSGFDWAIQQYRKDGTPQVLSNSWGIYQENWDAQYATNPNHPFTRKVVEALDEGILVLFAAGNCGQTCPAGRCGSDTGPGRSIWGANGHPRVMTVGAANIQGKWIGYSSQGPAALDPKKPDFCAISHFKGYFPSDTGTSAACPVAAGVVTLLKQSNKSLTQEQIKDAVAKTAKNLGPSGWDKHSGHGILRAKAAHEATAAPRFSGVWRAGQDPFYLWANASWNSFRAKWKELSKKNLRLVDFEAARLKGKWRYSGVWRQGGDAHYLWVNASRQSFVAKWKELAKKNLRLVDIEINRVGGNWRYSGVWRHGKDPYYLWINASWSSFVKKWKELAKKNLRLTKIDINRINGQWRFTGIWRGGKDPYYLWVNASWSSFVKKWQELAAQNLRLVDLEKVKVGGKWRYSGVWRAGSDSHYLWSGVTWKSFIKKWKKLAKHDLRLIDFEVHPGSSLGDGASQKMNESNFAFVENGEGLGSGGGYLGSVPEGSNDHFESESYLPENPSDSGGSGDHGSDLMDSDLPGFGGGFLELENEGESGFGGGDIAGVDMAADDLVVEDLVSADGSSHDRGFGGGSLHGADGDLELSGMGQPISDVGSEDAEDGFGGGRLETRPDEAFGHVDGFGGGELGGYADAVIGEL